MIIQVKQEHIDKGEPCNACKCPVALAITEQTSFDKVVVGPAGNLYFSHILLDNDTYSYPRSVSRFINKFDKYKTVKPFNFILRKM